MSLLSTKLDYDKTLKDLLREAALLIEWCAPNIPENLQNDLAFCSVSYVVGLGFLYKQKSGDCFLCGAELCQLLEACGLLS